MVADGFAVGNLGAFGATEYPLSDEHLARLNIGG
jgi:hypothetical protein